jgi:hypothetical protein
MSFILTYAHHLQSAYDGLWHDGWLILCGHLQFACAGEIHARSYDDGDEVGMYVSLIQFFHFKNTRGEAGLFQSPPQVTTPVGFVKGRQR